MPAFLTAEEKKALLTIARDAVEAHTADRPLPVPLAEHPNLQEQTGCFVCIKMAGGLRGCIGNFTSEKPLYQFVQEMAVSAASRDPRFYPVKKQEVEHMELEISVLTPLQKIASFDEIEMGTHGLYIEKNSFRGVLLPQVATEQGWDRDTFLAQTCLKAGLKRDDWQEGADIYVFRAEVFSEKDQD